MFNNFLTCCVVGLVGATPATAQTYHLTDLGDPGGVGSYGMGINANGEVIGGYSWFDGKSGYDRAFIWSNGVNTDLFIGYAAAINSAGQVVGAGYDGWAKFLYDHGVVTPLTFGYGSPQSVELDINETGHAVGSAFAVVPGIPHLVEHAFLYSNGTMQDLGALGGDGEYSRATGINSIGEIVGYAEVPDNPFQNHAFRYANGTMTDLGTLGGAWSYGSAINDAGQIVGTSRLADPLGARAFLYSDGLMTDLGTLAGDGDSYAKDINNNGQIIGMSAGGGAFLYTDGAMLNLTRLLDASGAGWTLIDVDEINDSGWIVGTASNGGSQYAVVLTPVPEPTSMMLLGTAAICLLRRRTLRPQRSL